MTEILTITTWRSISNLPNTSLKNTLFYGSDTFMKELRVSVAVCRPAGFRESAAGAKHVSAPTDHHVL